MFNLAAPTSDEEWTSFIMMYNLKPTPQLKMYIKSGDWNIKNKATGRKWDTSGIEDISEVVFGGAGMWEMDDFFVWDDVLEEDAINILLNRSK